MNVDEAMAYAKQLSGGSLNFSHHSNPRILAIGALYNEVERLRAWNIRWRDVSVKLRLTLVELSEELAAAKAAGVVPVDNWQSMETAPKDGTVILLATTLRVAESSWGVCRPQWDGYVANEGKPCWRASGEEKMRGGDPLYWMPMPQMPKRVRMKERNEK